MNEEPCYASWLHGLEGFNSLYSNDVSLNSLDSLSEDMLFDGPSFHDSSMHGYYAPNHDLIFSMKQDEGIIHVDNCRSLYPQPYPSFSPSSYSPHSVDHRYVRTSIHRNAYWRSEMAYPSVSANSPPFPVMPTRCREDSQNGEKGRSNNNKYHISLEALLSGEERRKTVMLRNIPNSFSQKTLLSILTSIIPASYEFVYMPVDVHTKSNLGFGYVSVSDTQSLILLYKAMHLHCWPNTNSKKVCEVVFARIQGHHDLRRMSKNWSIMKLPEEYHPLFFKREVVRINGAPRYVLKRLPSC